MKKNSLILFIIVAVLGIAIIFIKKYNNNDKPVRYAYVPTALVDAPSAISEDEFKKKGINAKPFSTGIETVQALIGGATDVATLAEMPFMLASLKRDDLRIVAVISTAKSLGMVVDSDKGIENVSDLAGKSVGFPKGTSAQYVYETLLDSYDVKDKVKAVNLTPPNLQSSINRGDVDAIVVWQPFLEKIIQSNPERFSLVKNSDDVLRVVYFVVTTESYLKKNPEGVKKILKILADSDKKIKSGDVETLRILCQKNNVNLETMKKVLPMFDYEVKIDSTIIDTFKKLSIWAAANGLADKKIIDRDWRHFIYPNLLKEVAPENVKY